MNNYSFTRLFFREKKLIILAFFLMAVQSLVIIINPLVMKYLIDRVIPSGNTELLPKIVIIILIVFVVEFIVNLSYRIVLPHIKEKTKKNLQSDILGRFLHSDLEFFNKSETGTLNNVIERDTYVVSVFIGKNLLPLFSQITHFIAVCIIIFALNYKFAALALLFLPICFFVYTSVGKKIEKIIPSYYRFHDRLSQSVLQILSGMEVIKAFNKEKEEHDLFDTISNDVVKAEKKMNTLDSFGEAGVSILGKLISMSFFLFSVLLIMKGQMTLGAAVAFYAYLGRLYDPAQELSSVIAQRKRSMESFRRIKEYVEMTPKIKDHPDALDKSELTEAIEIQNLSFAYNSGEYNVKDINIRIEKNTCIALVGESGSGKSTIAKLLMRFYDPDHGAVLFDGSDVKMIRNDRLRKMIGYVGQDSFLFNQSIKENILCGQKYDDEEVFEACKRVNIYDFIVSLKDGFDTVVGERGVKVSGGEKQRIAIARALLRKPEIIIFDEATSNLDSNNESIIQESMNQLSNQCTLIIIAHRLSTIKDVDYIYLLEKGKIGEQGTHDELIAKKEKYYSLWNRQSKEEF
ncbi:MAG: ABC transporter ATP-binding protein [Oscillospiraceae bacterium]|nr:ABC transporter ATP-binding protein [Oscillospiraceae bacterium]